MASVITVFLEGNFYGCLGENLNYGLSIKPANYSRACQFLDKSLGCPINQKTPAYHSLHIGAFVLHLLGFSDTATSLGGWVGGNWPEQFVTLKKIIDKGSLYPLCLIQ